MPPARRLSLAACLSAALAASALAACGGTDEPPVTVAANESGSESAAPIAAGAQPVTRNTSRIDGTDPIADAAQVAVATHPPVEGKPVDSVAVVSSASWQGGIAISSLAGDPQRMPILYGQAGSVPDPTADAVDALDPKSAYTIGDVEAPDGLKTPSVSDSEDPAEIANAVDELRAKLTGADPDAVLVVGEDHPAFAMPAAAWAARSGDPVLFVEKDSVPAATAAALRRHSGASVYLLGPQAVASDAVLRQIQRSAPNAIRIFGEDPVDNAIQFAQYSDGAFGWNITDPGHGLVFANADRPGDAGAASALSASGSYGPLLITDDAATLPQQLHDFLLSIQPGYSDDPTRAIYNHAWLIGDTSAISGAQQAQIDDLTELTKIGGSAEAPSASVPSTQPDEEIVPTTPTTPKKP